jgi:L-glyceraldehyde 3-phosphate reductase
VSKLNDIALSRGQSMAQMAIAWLLKDKRVTSVLVGASSAKQMLDNINSIKRLDFTVGELSSIESILSNK